MAMQSPLNLQFVRNVVHISGTAFPRTYQEPEFLLQDSNFPGTRVNPGTREPGYAYYSIGGVLTFIESSKACSKIEALYSPMIPHFSLGIQVVQRGTRVTPTAASERELRNCHAVGTGYPGMYFIPGYPGNSYYTRQIPAGYTVYLLAMSGRSGGTVYEQGGTSFPSAFSNQETSVCGLIRQQNVLVFSFLELRDIWGDFFQFEQLGSLNGHPFCHDGERRPSHDGFRISVGQWFTVVASNKEETSITVLGDLNVAQTSSNANSELSSPSSPSSPFRSWRGSGKITSVQPLPSGESHGSFGHRLLHRMPSAQKLKELIAARVPMERTAVVMYSFAVLCHSVFFGILLWLDDLPLIIHNALCAFLWFPCAGFAILHVSQARHEGQHESPTAGFNNRAGRELC
eukprot:3935042-Rhodomonas_salina.1